MRYPQTHTAGVAGSSKGTKIVVGSIFWTSNSRRRTQRSQVTDVVRHLRKNGYRVTEVNSSFQREPQEFKAMSVWAVWKIIFSSEKLVDRESHRRGGTKRKSKIILAIETAKLALSVASDPVWHQRKNMVGELSLKHLHIWNSVLHSGAAGALVFEDDFVVTSEADHQVMSHLLSKYLSKTDFIDLAGGFKREAIGLPGAPGEDLQLEYIASNTTCAYFVSRDACATLFNIIHSDSSAKYFGSDWLLNAVNDRLLGAKSVHPWRLPYVHGSLQGLVPSLFD